MLLKIAMKNIKRNIFDYIIYMITLVISFSIVNAVACLSSSEDILQLAENMEMLKNYSTIITIILVFVMSYLTVYVIYDILIKREKEFGILELSGMKKGMISNLFLTELTIVGVISLIVSIPIAIIIQKVLIFIVEKIFEDSNIKLNLMSEHSLMLLTMFFFGIIIISGLRIKRKLGKASIQDLLLEQSQNMQLKPKKSAYIIMLLLSISGIIIGVLIFIYALSEASNSIILLFFAGAIFIICGVYGVSNCGLALLVKHEGHPKVNGNYGLGLVLKGQLNAKISKNNKSIGVLSILLSFSFLFLMLGLSIGEAYKSNIKSEAPFDIAVSLDHHGIGFASVIDFISESVVIKDYLEYSLYENENNMNFTGMPFNDDYILLSDYNRLRQILGLNKITLAEKEYAIHCEGWIDREKISKHNPDTIKIRELQIFPKASYMYSEPFSQYGFNGKGYLIVVADSVKPYLNTAKSRLVVATNGSASAELKGEIKKFINGNEQLLSQVDEQNSRITMTITVKAWSHANGLVGLVVLSFSALYLSIIFAIISLTLLALQQLTQIDKQRKTLELLYVIGYNNQCKRQILISQLRIYFGTPVIVPVLLLFSFTFILQQYFGNQIVEPCVFVNGAVVAFVVLAIIYYMYYKITFFVQSKLIVKQGRV